MERLPKEIQAEIDAELDASAKQIAAGAKRDAPKDVGFLANEISSLKVSELTYDVVSAAIYSAFVEFGTRERVQIPAGLEEVAAEHIAQKGSTSLSARDTIYAWCDRKGIEQKMWYPIFISIMTKGIHPHPFFYQNFLREKPLLIARIKKIVEGIK